MSYIYIYIYIYIYDISNLRVKLHSIYKRTKCLRNEKYANKCTCVENTEVKMTRNLGSRSPPKNNKMIIITIITNSSIINLSQ